MVNYFLNLKGLSEIEHYIFNSKFKNTQYLKLRKLTTYKGPISHYKKNFEYLKLSGKKYFISLNTVMVKKNFYILNIIVMNLIKYNYNFLCFAGLKFYYETLSLNSFNKSIIFKHMFKRAVTNTLIDYISTKVNKLEKVAVFSVDTKGITKIRNMNFLLFTFINTNKKSYDEVYTILVDISYYLNTYLIIHYLYAVRVSGLNVKVIEYLSLLNYYKTYLKRFNNSGVEYKAENFGVIGSNPV